MNMIVICINNKTYPNLEINKPYKAKLEFPLTPTYGEKEWEQNYLTIEEDITKKWYDTKYFITIDKWRDSKLNKLGIE